MFPGNQNAKNAPAAARPAGSGGTSAPQPAPHLPRTTQSPLLSPSPPHTILRGSG